MMVSKGNPPQMALIQGSVIILIYPDRKMVVRCDYEWDLPSGFIKHGWLQNPL